MILVSIVAVMILFFSFMGGFFQGAVQSFFSLISFIVALPLAGLFYPFFARILSFLPGRNWENFLGFFISLAIASLILNFLFYLPRKITERAWKRGPISRLLGALLNLVGAALGIVVFALVLEAFPVLGWLQRAVSSSGVIAWLVVNLDFIQEWLPEVMRSTSHQTVLFR
jgi:uncharacterized membrane protein required for colicin V production